MTDIAHSADRSAAADAPTSNKVVQLKHAVQRRADAIGGWAQSRARRIRSTAEDKPFATAGVSAGAAFAAGIAVGLVIARAMAPRPPSWRERLRQASPW